MTTSQDVVVSEMGIGAGGAAMPGSGGAGLFACRSAASAGAMSMRQTYLDLAAAAARSANCTWAELEVMRAASPTRSRPGADVDDLTAWMRKHPSALAKFEQIASASKGKKIVMFLDYDGTLSPIVANPDAAYMSDAMREAVRDVAKHFPTAIVSGRCREKVHNFVGLSELYYAGSHGMDIKGPSSNPESVVCQPAREFLPVIEEVYKVLVEKTKSTPGAKVENNKFCLSVHFRCVDEKRWNFLAEQVKAVMKDYPMLKLTQGRKVFELRPSIMWDKGKALEFLLESLGTIRQLQRRPAGVHRRRPHRRGRLQGAAEEGPGRGHPGVQVRQGDQRVLLAAGPGGGHGVPAPARGVEAEVGGAAHGPAAGVTTPPPAPHQL